MTEQTVDQVVEQTQEQEAVAPTLGVKDLVALLNIIQVASNRGAFRVEEFTEVGTTFDRLKEFLVTSGAITLNQPNQPVQEPVQEQAEQPAE